MTTIRLATPADAAGVGAIYGPIVEQTATSFELQAPSEQDLAARIARTLEGGPWLIAQDGPDGPCLGYAYAVQFRARPAYAWSMEVSVYVHPDHHRRGVARALYADLFERLRIQGIHRLVAGVTLPNQASVTLHESLGFQPVGVFERVGFKFGAWHSVGFWERELQQLPLPPAPPLHLGRAADQSSS